MQRFVWGHKGNLNSIDGRSHHGAGSVQAEKLRLVSTGATTELLKRRGKGIEGHGTRWMTRRTEEGKRETDKETPARLDGQRRLQLLHGSLQPQVHCGKHKGILRNTGFSIFRGKTRKLLLLSKSTTSEMFFSLTLLRS